MEKGTDTELIHGLMEINMRGNGGMGQGTDTEPTLIRVEIKKVVIG